MQLTTRPLADPALRIRRYGNEAIAWSPIRQAPVHIDAISVVMLDVIDGIATVDELVRDVEDVLEVPWHVAHGQVTRALSNLADQGLLADGQPVDGEAKRAGLQSLLPDPDL